ncbi:unnamed protein product [Arabidopsis halleri]
MDRCFQSRISYLGLGSWTQMVTYIYSCSLFSQFIY